MAYNLLKTDGTFLDPKYIRNAQEEESGIPHKLLECPVTFVEEYLKEELTDYQREILLAIKDNRRVAVKSANGVGKSWLTARAAMWFWLAHEGSIVLVTAPTFMQVKGIIFKELGLVARKVKRPMALTTTEFRIRGDWKIVAISPKDEHRAQGWHSDNIMVCADEAPGIPEKVFEGLDSCLVTGNSKMLMIGNPTQMSGKFYREFSNPATKKFTVSSFDTPNFEGITSIGQLLRADVSKIPLKHKFLTNPVAVKDQINEYGETSPTIKSRVLAEFADVAEDNLIPRSSVEAAVEAEIPLSTEVPTYGLDVSGEGQDRTVLVKRYGDVVTDIWVIQGDVDMAITADKVAAKLGIERGIAYVDVIGIGAGMPALLRERGIEHVVGVKASSKANYPYLNARAAWAFRVRRKFTRGEIKIPHNEKLIDQLSDIRYTTRPDGKNVIERKDDIKSRTGESPDFADALMLSFAGGGEIDVDFPVEEPEPTADTIWNRHLRSIQDRTDRPLV